MPGSTLSVKLGTPQQLSGANLDPNTQVVNMDLSNAVWISSNGTVSPGNGLFLGPAASAPWSGKQLWACVDTGVLTPVTLNISDDVTQINNPVAVAAALALKGIPNTFLLTQIFSGNIANGQAFNCDQYASLLFYSSTSTVLGPMFVGITFWDGPNGTGNIVGSAGPQLGCPNINNGGAASSIGTWEIPVRGKSFSMATGANPVSATVAGTNRLVPYTRRISDTNNMRNISLTNAAFVGAVGYGMGYVDAPGHVMIEGIITNSTGKGSLFLTDIFGNVCDIISDTDMIVTAGAQVGRLERTLPQGMCNLTFNCNTGGSFTVILRIILLPD